MDGVRIGSATRRQYWPRRRTEVLGRLAPLRRRPSIGRRDDEDHERELEVQVDDHQARHRVQVNPVDWRRNPNTS